jgi:nucleoid DNA-binding protein
VAIRYPKAVQWLHRIRTSGLGILQVRKWAARIGRSPATGESTQRTSRKA